ncbi:TlpA family protein disulfide reductase [Robertkochia flava]|uniref:TlpA family protein disulfide reductase n=1 Tax=Robertkochia flava TaxID=3447986 RepID=UPI001CCB1E8E|nr:TlpA disulfide reductase family protein [Robertkochia marina]
MVKLDKKKLYNLIFLVVFGVLFFTPLGTPVKVFIHRLVAFSPAVESADEREILDDYEWILEDMNGERAYFGDLKGQVVVINFWATWCPPCIAEMPSFQELYSDYGDRVHFLFVSQEEHQKLRDFLVKRGYDIPVYHPLSKIPEQLYSQSIPATYIIDREGGIRVSKVGVADWNSAKVRDLLEALTGS